MCDDVATSREHVPPKCIFPSGKDIQGQDFRSQLITVPSCNKHNSQKSDDDEFLMVSLAGIIGNNSIGYRQNFTKVSRAICKSSGKLLDQVFVRRKHYKIELKDNSFLDVIHGTPDQGRLIDCFNRIGRALYRHQFAKTFLGETRVVFGHLYSEDADSNTFIQFIKHRIEIELREGPRLGANPSVFYFQFTEPDQHGFFTLKTCFYEGVEVFVAFYPIGKKVPFNLGQFLIDQGMHSFIELEGKSYEFNKTKASGK